MSITLAMGINHMMEILLAAGEDDSNLMFDLCFDSSGAYDRISEQRASIYGTATLSQNYKLPGQASSLYLPGLHSAYASFPALNHLVHGTRDFTYIWDMVLLAHVPYSNHNLVTPIYWGSTAQPGNPVNVEVTISESPNPALGVQMLTHGLAVSPTTAVSEPISKKLPLNEMVRVSVIRRDGQLWAKYNDEIVSGPRAYTPDMRIVTDSQIIIGKRPFSASASYCWRGHIASLKIYDKAKGI